MSECEDISFVCCRNREVINQNGSVLPKDAEQIWTESRAHEVFFDEAFRLEVPVNAASR
jgi:hypothetical protein